MKNLYACGSTRRPKYIRMLTFAEFIVESIEGRQVAWGFLRPGKKPLKSTTRKDAGTHQKVARKLGYGGQSPVESALKSGLVRYEHIHDPRTKEHYAGYEFHDTPKSRQMVTKHLGEHGGFRDIRLDHHEPIGHIKSHWFHDVQSAVKHLQQH